jgi:hypothetical protein
MPVAEAGWDRLKMARIDLKTLETVSVDETA